MIGDAMSYTQPKVINEAPENPRLKLGSRLVPYETPAHVTELVLTTVKELFRCLPEDHPYHFTDDFNTTGVLVDTSFNRASEIWGKKPMITVARGMQNAGVLVLGDMATKTIPTDVKMGSNLVTATTDIHVVSKSRAETEVIAERVFAALMMLRTHGRRLLGVHMVSNLSMTQPQKLDQDDECFVVDISMQYYMQYLWEDAVPVTLLQSIGMHANSVRMNVGNTSAQSLG